MYYNRFFKTLEDARAFQRIHGGVLYSNVPRSRTKQDYKAEMAVALDARQEVVNPEDTPFVVAWNG